MNRRSSQGSKGGFGVAIILATVSAAAFYAASLTAPSALKPKSKTPRDQCRVPDAPMGDLAPAFRGSTAYGAWNKFEPRKRFELSKPSQVDAPAIAGRKALAIEVNALASNAYGIGVSMVNRRKIERGEIITAQVWLRGVPMPGNTAPVIIDGVLQDNAAGFRRVKSQKITLTGDYVQYSISARATRIYCANELNFALHLATGAQTVNIGLGTITAEASALLK